MKQPKAYSYIRFSTPEQLKGDSLRRQVEASEKYCKEHGLTLDTSLNLRDLGLSAFRGKYQKALEEFLKLVESGKIEKGSVLIVENLDRLSRKKVMDAFDQFRNIIRAGIKLVTLMDGQEYTWESVNKNPTQLIISITYMARAHDESKIKSDRISAAWDNKRKNGKIKILTARCPAWLQLSEDRTHFIKRKEVVRVVKRIFKMKLDGIREERIASELNKTDLWRPPETERNKNGGWSKLYIARILRSRAVIGEFTPHRMVKIEADQKDQRYKAKEGRLTVGYPTREPASDPIVDYFPAIIDLQTFNRTQYMIQETLKQKGYFGGQTGKASNLFVYLVKCGLCGSTMHYLDKGKPPKGFEYLHCDHSRRNLGCDAKAIRYDEFQDIFFNDLKELDISKLNPDQEEFEKETDLLQATIEDNKQRLNEVSNQINNTTDAIAFTGDKAVRGRLIQKLAELERKKSEGEKLDKELEHKLSVLHENSQNQREKLDVIKEVRELLDKAKDEDQRINFRLRIRAELQKLIESMTVYPLQEKYPPAPETDSELQDGEVFLYRYKSGHIRKITIRFKGVKKMRILVTLPE